MKLNSIRFFYGTDDAAGTGTGGDQKSESATREDSVKGKDQVDQAREKLFPEANVNGDEKAQRIRAFRQQIDSLYLTTKELSNKPFLTSREISIAVTNFQSARQFAGKILETTKSVSPYDGKNFTPRQDVGELLFEEYRFKVMTSDEAAVLVTELRENAETVIKKFSAYVDESDTCENSIESVSEMSVLQGLIAGKMWLGELFAILKAPKE